MGTAGEVIKAELCCPVLRIQTGAHCSFQLVVRICDPWMLLDELDSFYKEETSSSTPSKPDVLRHVSFTLCIQTLMTVLSYKLRLNSWKLEGVTQNLEIKNCMPWKSAKDFHGNSKNMVKSISVNRRTLALSPIFIFFLLLYLSLLRRPLLYSFWQMIC